MAKILSSIAKFLWPEEHESLSTPDNVEAVFVLFYEAKNLIIGYLSLKDGEWEFKYSEEFKNQETIKPLPDFPDIENVYVNTELHPFFSMRIPSTKQPKIRQIIKRKKIDENNAVELLKNFGRNSINNPFHLQPQ